jgi:putative methyltransferase (TIGR04325 family)
MEPNYINSWTESRQTFVEQLKFGINQVNDKIPSHLLNIEEILKNIDIKRVIDIGCGAGILYYIIGKNLPNLEYIGYDYSQHAIDVATKQWGPFFFLKNYKDLKRSDFEPTDILIANALVDVMKDGYECLEFLLSLNLTQLLISRIKITDKNDYYEVNKAYDITIYTYYHNYDKLIELIRKYGYSEKIFILSIENDYSLCNLLLEKRIVNDEVVSFHGLSLDDKLMSMVDKYVDKRMTEGMDELQATHIKLGEYLFKLGLYINKLCSELLKKGQWDFVAPDWFDHRHHLLNYNDNKNSWTESISIVLRKLKEGDKILDLCAGDAFFSNYFFSKKASEIMCIDEKSDMYKKYITHHINGNEKIKYIIANMLEYNIPKDYFDIVYMRGSIEHFSYENQLRVVEIAYNSLKNGGWFVGETPQKTENPRHAEHEFEWDSEECGKGILSTKFKNSHLYSIYCNIDPRTTIFWECQK